MRPEPRPSSQRSPTHAHRESPAPGQAQCRKTEAEEISPAELGRGKRIQESSAQEFPGGLAVKEPVLSLQCLG